MVRHQVHHAIDTLVRGHGGHTVLHYFLHKHRPGCLAIARKCMNDFAFGNETKNCVLTRHYESTNILCTEPVCRPLDAGLRSYCCDVGALAPQNAFDAHSLLHRVAWQSIPGDRSGIVVPIDLIKVLTLRWCGPDVAQRL